MKNRNDIENDLANQIAEMYSFVLFENSSKKSYRCQQNRREETTFEPDAIRYILQKTNFDETKVIQVLDMIVENLSHFTVYGEEEEVLTILKEPTISQQKKSIRLAIEEIADFLEKNPEADIYDISYKFIENPQEVQAKKRRHRGSEAYHPFHLLDASRTKANYDDNSEE